LLFNDVGVNIGIALVFAQLAIIVTLKVNTAKTGVNLLIVPVIDIVKFP